MSIFVLVLILSAAAIHTIWNLLVKRAGERQIFLWWGWAVGSVLILPALFLQPLPENVWPFMLGSAIVEAVYFGALTNAYRLNDFSLVYPIARGTAPFFLFFWTVLFLGEQPKLLGVAGLSLIVFGLMTVGADAVWQRRDSPKVQLGGIAAALGVAVCISIYSAIDGTATRVAPPIAYLAVVQGLTTLFTAPFIVRKHGRQPILAELRAHWQLIILVGIGITAAYLLVLYAYSMAKVSYVGAAREISIVFAAFVGWRWLGERFGILRLAGALLLFCGIFVISLAG